MNSGQYLKCDAPGCDHREDIEQLAADMVGKPCPKCGENLLTQEDFEQFEVLSKRFADLMRYNEMLLADQPEPEPGQVGTLISMNLHDGEFTLKMKPVTV